MRVFDDLPTARLLYLKGVLFVVLAVLAGAMLLARVARIDVALLMMICVWGSCRAYYFAFYVIEHYADPGYRYSGLVDFARYALGKKSIRSD